MIAKSIWISLYAILIFGFIYIGAHFAIHLTKEPHPVYEELKGELENPTPRAVYMAKYKKFLERKQSPISGSAGNIKDIHTSSSKTAPPAFKEQLLTKLNAVQMK